MIEDIETEMSCELSTACTAGYFGFNCLNKCSKYCWSVGECDTKTEECRVGCQAGWKKPTCEAS